MIKHNFRLYNAEINRDKSVAERIQRAHITTQRTKLVEQKEAQRKIDSLQAITG